MAKIEPFKPYFQNMNALLARIGEDENAVGFVGCILMKDGIMKRVHFNVSRAETSFAGAMLLTEAVEGE